MVNKTRKPKDAKQWGERYSALSMGGKGITDDLSESLTFSCTNKAILAEYTEIPYNRLVYIFTKKKKTFLVENDFVIIRSNVLYKGKQRGGMNGKSLHI